MCPKEFAICCFPSDIILEGLNIYIIDLKIKKTNTELKYEIFCYILVLTR